MRAVVQRVSSSKVTVDNKIVGAINKGFNILLGIAKNDKIENDGPVTLIIDSKKGF